MRWHTSEFTTMAGLRRLILAMLFLLTFGFAERSADGRRSVWLRTHRLTANPFIRSSRYGGFGLESIRTPASRQRYGWTDSGWFTSTGPEPAVAAS